MKKFTVRIITKTGLHIGSGNSIVEIGGMDQPVIKTMNWFPYIPASSLKGKLRSLYEVSLWAEELSQKNNWLKEFDGEHYDEVSMFFGKSGTCKQNLDQLGPTRFLFRDLFLKKELSENDKENGWMFSQKELENKKKQWDPIFEEKTEVAIDRFTWTAANSWPRPLQRVPAGTVFEWKLIVREFGLPNKDIEQNNLKKFWDNFEKLKEMIENDYLWWQGTRWNGAIQIDFIRQVKD